MLNDIFDKIYLVNMDKDIHRLENAKKVFATYGMEFERVVGVDSSSVEYATEYGEWSDNSSSGVTFRSFKHKVYADRYEDLKDAFGYDRGKLWHHWLHHGIKEGRSPLNDDTMDNEVKKNIMEKRAQLPPQDLINNAGQWGCIRSHINILRDAIDNNLDRILIFEDDIILHKNFNKQLKTLKKLMMSEWHVIYLGVHQHRWTNKIRVHENHYRATGSFGTFAYAIHSSVFQELLDIFNEMIKPVDVYLVDYQKRDDRQCYVIYPNIVISDVTESNTGEDLNLKNWSYRVKWNLSDYDIPNQVSLVNSRKVVNKVFEYANKYKINHAIIKKILEKKMFDPNFYKNYYLDLKNMPNSQAERHWLTHGLEYGRCGSLWHLTMISKYWELYLKKDVEQFNKLVEDEILTQYPFINVLTRTSDRKELFIQTKKSIESQVYNGEIRHIVSCDTDNTYNYLKELKYKEEDIVRERKCPQNGPFFYNLYCNDLLDRTRDGWIIFLDDDDLFTSEYCIKRMVFELENINYDKDHIIVWRLWRPDRPIYPIDPNQIRHGEVGSCSFMFHNKHKNNGRFSQSGSGDFEFFRHMSKKLKVIYIDSYLAKINNGLYHSGHLKRVNEENNIKLF